MYKPPRTFLPSRAKRRQASHLFREFLRGAGAGALDRGSKLRRRWGLGALVGIGAAVLAPHLAGTVLLLGVSSAAGVVAYLSVQAVAAVAHRVANKGIPEAPNHNRKAQKWGRRVTKVVAGAGFVVVTSATAGFTLATTTSQPTRVPSWQQKYPAPKFIKTTHPEQPVVSPAPRRTTLTL